MRFRVLHEDNHLLVVDKPAGIPIQADRSGDSDLLSEAKAYVKDRFQKPGRVYLGLVHRLDRPVSGVVIFARTSKAAARLSDQFRDRTVGKQYIAIVEGRVSDEDGYLTHYLRKSGRHVHKAGPEDPGARYADLTFRRLDRAGSLTLLAVYPATGRPHQIRVQLAWAGYPILGDLRYGAKRSFDGRNLALHCHAMRVEHPVRKIAIVYSADLPEIWYTVYPKSRRHMALSW